MPLVRYIVKVCVNFCAVVDAENALRCQQASTTLIVFEDIDVLFEEDKVLTSVP